MLAPFTFWEASPRRPVRRARPLAWRFRVLGKSSQRETARFQFARLHLARHRTLGLSASPRLDAIRREPIEDGPPVPTLSLH